MSSVKLFVVQVLRWGFLVFVFGFFVVLLPVLARFVLAQSVSFISVLADDFALVVGGVLVGGACLMVVGAWFMVSVLLYRKTGVLIDKDVSSQISGG